MRRIIIILTCTVALSACAKNTETAHLAQSMWRFERIDGQRPHTDLARITFQDDAIGVDLGCGSLDGPWRLNAGRLVAGPLDQKQSSCDQKAWTQSSAVNALLVATPRVSFDGKRMTLQSRGHSAELVRIDENGTRTP